MLTVLKKGEESCNQRYLDTLAEVNLDKQAREMLELELIPRQSEHAFRVRKIHGVTQ